MIKGLFD